MSKIRFRLIWALAGLLGLGAVGLSATELQQTNYLNRIQNDGSPIPSVGASAGQFASAVILGASAPLSTPVGSEVVVKDELNATPRFTLGHTRVGMPFFGRASTFLFAQVIPPPDHEVDGATETGGNAYWEPRPYRASDSLGVEWNVQLKKVVALRDANAGEFQLTWRVKTGQTDQPSGDPGTDFVQVGRQFHRLRVTTTSVSRGVVISPPATQIDESTAANADYWEPIPEELREPERYYYSPSTRLVYATQPGSVNIVWRTRDYLSQGSPPGGFTADQYIEVGGNYYGLFSTNYVISGVASQPPRTIYWNGTEDSGIPVLVPDSRISDVKIVYNSDFPEDVPISEGTPLNSDSGASSEGSPITISQTATFWYSQAEKALNARNREGRVFMELLGQPSSGGIPQHLGIEIVDVKRLPIPVDRIGLLGEAIASEGTDLKVEIQNQPEGEAYVYRHFTAGEDSQILYARRETEHVNDLMLWWLEPGQQGIYWPKTLARYDLNWPTDPAAYSHYIRSAAATDAEAQATSVTMPSDNIPQIEFQDRDPAGQERAQLTADFSFYTRLDDAMPAHRTLMRFTSGDHVRFERVFSWLDAGLRANAERIADAGAPESPLNGSLVESLAGWDEAAGTIQFAGLPMGPRFVSDVALVGTRIEAPGGEPGGEGGYLAGHLDYRIGEARPRRDGFNAGAYVDPLTEGFAAANAGAIIPVNAIPGDSQLQVWWFRSNTVDTTAGFKPIYWPAVIGQYTVRYPEESDTVAYHEIILASNDGTGPLPSLLAQGSIYFENDATKPGYNPNEEHALMLGGQGYALRDDLNITATQNTSDGGFSSEPFVLLNYTESDGRPAMRAYRVLREKDAVTFRYPVAAGTILQPPMPLPLLDKPEVYRQTQQQFISLNEQAALPFVTGNSVSVVRLNPGIAVDIDKLSITTSEPLYFDSKNLVYLHPPVGSDEQVKALLVDDTDATSVFGFVSDVHFARMNSGKVVEDFLGFDYVNQYEYEVAEAFWEEVAVNDQIFVIAEDPDDAPRDEQFWWWVTVKEKNQVTENASEGHTLIVEFPGVPGTVPDVVKNGGRVMFLDGQPKDSYVANQFLGWTLSTAATPPSRLITDEGRGSYTFQDRKKNIWVYRGALSDGESAVFDVQYYYKTLAGFFFPSLPLDGQPPVGEITPYLTPPNSESSKVYGNSVDPADEADGNALRITYEPYWPLDAPVLHMAETLTLPKRGLPAVRGQTSLQILADQAALSGSSDADKSVVLHDPTREKIYLLGAQVEGQMVEELPASISKSVYQGKTYFPGLPPHLVDRFFFDPSRGEHGALVLRGEFFDAPVGEDYLLLNVLTPEKSNSDDPDGDVDYLKSLVAEGDSAKEAWDQIIASGLTTTLELFVPRATQPGTFGPAPTENQIIGPTQLAAIGNDDIAVDSYALTATGSGTGYVTLIAGNGRAFTPEAEPVSMHVIRVVNTLHRGELKIVESSNPLGEKVAFQQVVDLAGQTDDYAFEWKIAAPVDGVPPAVFLNEPVTLLGAGNTWRHLKHPLADDSTEPNAGNRVSADVRENVVAVSPIPFTAVATNDNDSRLTITAAAHALTTGNKVVLRNAANMGVTAEVEGTPAADSFVLNPDWDTAGNPASFQIASLHESAGDIQQPQSIVYGEFSTDAGTKYNDVWLSLELDAALGAKVYLNQNLVAVLRAADGTADVPTSSAPGNVPALTHAWRLESEELNAAGTENTIRVELFSQSLPGTAQGFDLRVDAFAGVDQTQIAGTQWLDFSDHQKLRAVLGGTADIRTLSDNYVIMRYKATDSEHASFAAGWSRWTEPVLAEGWIKRVLAGINPFNQRVTDLFANRVDTDASILTEAGPRWEGNVALNLESINDFGLIEIYETVLNRGKDLSIDAGINYGPANDALLLAAGYLNDLYMMIGNEAFADAANPTIGIGTADNTYGDVATALFAFKGQLPNLLEEELALLRGRDDFMQPGVEIAPAYNRLFWNFTRGIDSGEVIYALNYNIMEDNDDGVNGTINADDARKMFPQGHGDAYGHYLTALKGYYRLLMDEDFTWVPRTEAVNVLGKPVQVDYLDERKFAAAAAATARTGKQVFDLTWRKDYRSGDDNGWEHFTTNRVNSTRQQTTTRYWGMDHWANRVHQGAYFNWVAGNAMLPEVDADPSHEGIQKIDRTTVPELKELAVIAEDLQTSLDNAEAGLNPLGLPDGAIAMDINPAEILGSGSQTHFEQIYGRATRALRNATVAFDDAKDVTRLLRSEQDSLADFQTKVAHEELAYRHRLIENYGTPYTDDIGPGKTYDQGYGGPDLHNFRYVDNVELSFPDWLEPRQDQEFEIDVEANPFGDSFDKMIDDNDLESTPHNITNLINLATYVDQRDTHETITLRFGSHGFFDKPAAWTGRRVSPGKLQSRISDVILAVNGLHESVEQFNALKGQLDREVEIFFQQFDTGNKTTQKQFDKLSLQTAYDAIAIPFQVMDRAGEDAIESLGDIGETSTKSLPSSMIFGMASGGDLFSAADAALSGATTTSKAALRSLRNVAALAQSVLEIANRETDRWFDYNNIDPLNFRQEIRVGLQGLDGTFGDAQLAQFKLNQKLQALDQAWRNYYATLAEGDRIQAEREVFRQRSAAVIQGFRTRDSAFRLFRNEKLERYKSLFDLASQYAFLAAQAYDYETGLLGTDQGKAFVSRIISSRSLGVVKDGEPHFAGSNSGDPGLSSTLAEMKADWDVLKGRLGFNNHDTGGTIVSLRQENYRIVPSSNGDPGWKDILEAGRRDNLLADDDVRRLAMNIDSDDGLSVPGIVLEFSSTIEKGRNFFGRPLAGGDHNFSASSFATKIFSVGVALEGYQGMDDPSANSGVTGDSSTADPTAAFLDPLTLSATPDVYLIPVGTDFMRSPPLGDQNSLRSWDVLDVTIPLPFNIGASEFSSKPLWQSRDSLTEELFGIRKHQAFRPVSSVAYFPQDVARGSGIGSSQFTNSRLIGRSVWNTRWKLIIPGYGLLNDPNEGLDRFIQTVKDIKIHLATYSYSGN